MYSVSLVFRLENILANSSFVVGSPSIYLFNLCFCNISSILSLVVKVVKDKMVFKSLIDI